MSKAKAMRKAINFLKKRWVAILVIIWIICWSVYAINKYITLSFFQLTLGIIFFCVMAYSMGKHSAREKLEFECNWKDETISELKEEIEYLKEEIKERAKKIDEF